MFHAQVVAAVGGMLYRFDPTTLAFQPKPGAFYFPSMIELFVSIGFVGLAIAAFMFLVKVLAILPAPTRLWYSMEAQQWGKVKSISGRGDRRQYAIGD
jgi:Ni/Fe-hydrogenase subunit HybB-like protein